MKIWITRHGQTKYNKMKLMQGRTDEPLNETGIAQAKAARERIGDVHFDAVYASPLDRAIVTGAIIGGVSRDEVIIDERIIETDFGKYELHKYSGLGPRMSLYWALPEVFPAPPTVETVASMVQRSREFPENLWDYRLVIHCGGCMLNGREMQSRMNRAVSGGLPFTNYGIAIAYMRGILKRSIAMLPGIGDEE